MKIIAKIIINNRVILVTPSVPLTTTVSIIILYQYCKCHLLNGELVSDEYDFADLVLHWTSESDVHGRQILTSKVDTRAVRVKNNIIVELWACATTSTVSHI